MVFPRLAAYADWGLLALRVVIGIIFVVHGWPKIPNAQRMARAFGQDNAFGTALFAGQGAVETLGGVAMILGVLVQVVAIAFAMIMVAAIIVKNTMMVTGFVGQQTTGWEFDLVLLAANLALLLLGPGRLALMPHPRPLSRRERGRG